MATFVETDVLVIGGGGAAARAALEAGLSGAEVMLVTKGGFGAVGTRGSGATAGALSEFGVFATPGWTGPASEEEKRLSHMIFPPREQALANILQVGLGMADPKLAQILVEEAVETRTALLNWGVTFGRWGIRSHGVPIMEALTGQIKRSDISVRERLMIVNLLVQGGECLGAVGVDEINGDIVVIKAGATVIATGGDANLFMLNLNPSCITGDGYVMGYEAGAELMNLEFKQIFLGTIYPTNNMIVRLPPHVRLTNASGEEFIQNYVPDGFTAEQCLGQRQKHNPFSTRDALSKYVDIAIINEVKAGRGTDHNGIWFDRTNPKTPPITLFRNEFWLYRGIDFSAGPVEVGLCHHSSLGGFRIDENAQTTLPNLYAAGESAAGSHGADRMGGHMLLASQVFGAKAGRHGASSAKSRKLPDIDEKVLNAAEERIIAIRDQKGSEDPIRARRELEKSAYFNLLVIRNEQSLNRIISDVKNLREETIPRLSVANPQELVSALELQNLLHLAEIEANIFLKRKESRGPHYREEFPGQDDKNWLKSILVRKANEKPQLDTVTLDPKWKSETDEKIGYWG